MGENIRVCGLLQSSSPYLGRSPSSQTVGEVGKDGEVGKRVRGVECGCCDVGAAELRSRRGLAGAARVGDMIKKKNKTANLKKSLCFGINLGSMLPGSHGGGDARGRRTSLEAGVCSLSPAQGLCWGKSHWKRDLVPELTWGRSIQPPPRASQAGRKEPFGASAAGKGDYSRNSAGIETQELPGLLGQHRLPVLVVLGRKTLKKS